MNWNNYLSQNKSPNSYAHLGVLEGAVRCPFDISELPNNTKILGMNTPLKKFKLTYTNYDSLIGNEIIEAITLNDLDENRINTFSTLPNLKYLHVSNNKQISIPSLSPLKSLEVLILSGIKKVENIDFIKDLKKLKTLYVYGINNLYDITPIETLINLKELWLDHGKMSGTGKAIRSMEPISKLTNLEYLNFIVNIENKNYDISPLLELKKINHLRILPRFLKNGQKEIIEEKFPNINIV
ncbi:leucine-rich repeat domain-containing protein [Aquimarina hainanensis]|uniref:Leucine-rich repeat domain-containing protein n=1 Tax=Aquimarina hainanensis TaxID=1578017 RepID=A0ABW5NCH8_9FLAO|nr:leucine-rich repeat domain-containing protein [Aquimarina sp. TRL1]QKX04068.1 leucine-rich repeat domain-containing protein [Aquimarina sp. TRL1]